MAYYAWSEIRYDAEVTEDGVYAHPVSVMPGGEVSASKLKLSKEQFQELVDAGAVREEKFPVPEGDTRSPREWYLDKAREMEDAPMATGGSTFAPTTESSLADVVDSGSGKKSGSS